MSEPNMLTHLEIANVRAATCLRAYYMALAKRVMRGHCCDHPLCDSAAELALWLELRAVPWEA